MAKKTQKGFRGEKLSRGIYRVGKCPHYHYGYKLKNKEYVRKCSESNDLKDVINRRQDEMNTALKISSGFARREVTLLELRDSYCGSFKGRKKRIREVCFGRFLKRFGNIPIHEIGIQKIGDYRVWRENQPGRKGVSIVSFPTINRDMAVLRHALGCVPGLFDIEYLSPFIRYKTTKLLEFPSEAARARTRYLSIDEKNRLFHVMQSPDLRALVFFAVNTGMREGEIMAARWIDIDWELRQVKVPMSKSGKFRFINFDERFREFLKRLPKVSEFIFGYDGYESDKNLWWHYRGRWMAAVRVAQIKNFRFHDLRHTFATYMLKKGASLPALQDLLGHASITTTMRYAHVTDEQKEEAVKMIASAFSDVAMDADLCHADVIHGTTEMLDSKIEL